MLKKIIIYIALLLPLGLSAQDYSFRLYGAKEGIEVPELNCIFQDSRGGLWMGGVNGINRYDGVHFTNYNKASGLPDNKVLGISEGKDHNLWISSVKGICKFNGERFTNYKIITKGKPTKGYFFQNVFETANGQTFAFGEMGLFLLDKPHMAFEQIEDIKCNVREMAQDRDGKLWIATVNGLYTCENNIYKLVLADTGEVINHLTCIAIDKKNNIWLGTSNGIVKYDRHHFEKYFTDKSASSVIRDILVAADSSIVFTSDSPEIKIYKAGKFSSVDLTYLISRASILRAIQDSEGNFWLATTSGLVKMYSKPFRKYFLSDRIGSPVNAITKDKFGNLFFGTMNGLFKYDSERLQRYVPSNKPDEQFIGSITSVDSFLYTGTYCGQVFKFVENKFIPFGNVDYNSPNPVYQILPVGNELWICKGYNVVHYSNNKFDIYDFSNPASNFTQSALQDYKGDIWFAHYTDFTKYAKGKFTAIDSKEGFNYDAAATLVNDNNHNLWIGTYGNGLIKYDGKTYKAISTSDGIASQFLSSCLFDKKKNTLWIGTINGASQIRLNNNGDIVSIKNYNIEQGMEAPNCNQNSIFQLPNSNILFGTDNGLYEYKSSAENTLATLPNLNLTGLRINYEIPEWGKLSDSLNTWTKLPLNLTLPYNKNHLTFDFIGINFDDPLAVKYQWMLEGFDTKWNPASKNSFATYSNLPYGNFLFKIRACNSDGLWCNPVSYTFVILPPFWKTWWFILIVILSVLFLSRILFNKRIEKIKKQESEKTENFRKLAEMELKAMRAQMNPHFMFNALNSIQDVIISKNEEKASIYLADFARLMRLILENSPQKRIKLENELEFIQLYLNLEQLRFGDKFKMKINIGDDVDISSVSIPPMLIQPYIENAIIHGLMHKEKGGLLEIKFIIFQELDKSFLKCTITDNGIGRKRSSELDSWKHKKHKSMGMEISKERIHILNAIEPAKGFDVKIIDLEQGTSVELTIPIN